MSFLLDEVKGGKVGAEIIQKDVENSNPLRQHP
jgi:hypothetical protein